MIKIFFSIEKNILIIYKKREKEEKAPFRKPPSSLAPKKKRGEGGKDKRVCVCNNGPKIPRKRKEKSLSSLYCV